MKTFLSRALAFVLVLVVGLMGCSAAPGGLSGQYGQDTVMVIEKLRTAIDLAPDAPERAAVQTEARKLINDFFARYRRDESLIKLSSFTTMRTAIDSLAGHYASYPNRPVPEKLKNRLEQEFKQVESALRREG